MGKIIKSTNCILRFEKYNTIAAYANYTGFFNVATNTDIKEYVCRYNAADDSEYKAGTYNDCMLVVPLDGAKGVKLQFPNLQSTSLIYETYMFTSDAIDSSLINSTDHIFVNGALGTEVNLIADDNGITVHKLADDQSHLIDIPSGATYMFVGYRKSEAASIIVKLQV